MAAELGSSKLNAENHVYLDQPLLKLPHELVKRNFRNTQRYVEREREHILPVLKETANAALTSRQTPDQTIASLDAMIARMQNFKRKLEKLNTEEEALHEHTSKRIKHLQDLFEINSLSDVKYEQWSRIRLDRLTVDYLLRSGYSKTAANLAEAKQISHLIDLETFTACHKIAASISRGETKEALVWINENKNLLKKMVQPPLKTTNLEFELRLQQYIELVRANRTIDAREHASAHLAAHATSRSETLMHAAGLLVQPSNTTAEPYRSFFSSSRWSYLSNMFVETHHTLLSLPTQPLLHVALSAGLSALKTPACHSQHNPASSSTRGHAKMATNTSLCPICSMELNDLARNVPYAHHTTSSVEAEPVVLPNNRIYGRGRLEELQRKLAMAGGGADNVEIGKQGEVVDPTTGQKFTWDQVRKVYIIKNENGKSDDHLTGSLITKRSHIAVSSESTQYTLALADILSLCFLYVFYRHYEQRSELMIGSLLRATLQATAVSAVSNFVGQFLNCWIKSHPFEFNFLDWVRFLVLHFITAPANYKWQELLESTFPAHDKPTRVSIPLTERDVEKDSNAGDSEDEEAHGRDRYKRRLNVTNTMTKWFIDCITLGAIMNTSAFLIIMGILKRQPLSKIGSNLQTKTLQIITDGYKIWPLASIISFSFIPLERRLQFFAIVGLFWNIYMTLVAVNL